jgi:hypothetical protein
VHALRNEPSGVENEDPIGIAHRRQSVRNHGVHGLPHQ